MQCNNGVSLSLVVGPTALGGSSSNSTNSGSSSSIDTMKSLSKVTDNPMGKHALTEGRLVLQTDSDTDSQSELELI